MLGKKKGKQRNEYVPDYVLYDLETTGISSLYDEVIEISAVKVRNGKIVDEFSELVNPGRHIPYAASKVNNISDKMVEKALTFEKVLPEFTRFHPIPYFFVIVGGVQLSSAFKSGRYIRMKRWKALLPVGNQ